MKLKIKYMPNRNHNRGISASIVNKNINHIFNFLEGQRYANDSGSFEFILHI